MALVSTGLCLRDVSKKKQLIISCLISYSSIQQAAFTTGEWLQRRDDSAVFLFCFFLFLKAA